MNHAFCNCKMNVIEDICFRESNYWSLFLSLFMCCEQYDHIKYSECSVFCKLANSGGQPTSMEANFF